MTDPATQATPAMVATRAEIDAIWSRIQRDTSIGFVMLSEIQDVIATARAYHRLREAAAPIVERCRGNPSAVYTWGWDEEQFINTLVQVFDATALLPTQDTAVPS